MDHWDVQCRTDSPQGSVHVRAFHIRENCEGSTSGVVCTKTSVGVTDVVTVISPSSSPIVKSWQTVSVHTHSLRYSAQVQSTRPTVIHKYKK